MPSAFATPANTEPYTMPTTEFVNGTLELVCYRQSDNARCRPAYFDGADRLVIGKPAESFAGLARNANGNIDHLAGDN